MVNVTEGVLVECDPAIKQFLLHLDDTQALGKRFVIEDLDGTHLFVQPDVVSTLEQRVMSTENSEHDEWEEISGNVLSLTAEHYSFLLLKCFTAGWNINPLWRETAHNLCMNLLLAGPPVADLPDDADFNKLALHAAAELVFHVTCIADKDRPHLFVREGSSMVEDDLVSLLFFGRILLRYYNSNKNATAVKDVKAAVADLFALNIKTHDDEFCAIIREIWTSHSASQFGAFSKLKSRRPSLETVKSAVLRVAENVVHGKNSHGTPSVLHRMFSEAQKALLEKGDESHGRHVPIVIGASTSDEPVVQPVLASTQPAVEVNIGTLFISPEDIAVLPMVDATELSRLHAAFNLDKQLLPSTVPLPEEHVLRPIQEYFEKNPAQRLIIPSQPLTEVVAAEQQSLPPKSPARHSDRQRPKKKLDLMQPKPLRNGVKRNAAMEAPLQPVTESSPPQAKVRATDRTASRTILPPAPQPVVQISPEKSPPPIFRPIAAVTRTTPTAETNPMIRALVRGAAQRINAQKGGSDASVVSCVSQENVSTSSVSHPVQMEKPVEINPTASTKSVPVVPVAANTAIITNVHANTSDSTPSVAARPRLAERIGAPQSSESGASELAFSSDDSDTEEAAKKKRKKRRPWTVEEYKAVVAGVKRFGEGRWREIQLFYPVLKHRTNVGVKDAYRLVLRNPQLASK